MSDKAQSTGVTPDAEQPAFVSLELVLNPQTKELKAVISPSEKESEVNLESLKTKLNDEGYQQQLEIQDSTLLDLVKRVNTKQCYEVVLGTVQTPIGIRLEYESESRKLFANLEEDSSAKPISFADMQNRLKKEGYDGFTIANNDISGVLVKLQQRQLGRFQIGTKPEYTELHFRFDEETNELFAVLSASEENTNIKRETIQEILEEEGYANFFFQPNALDKLFTQISKNDRGSYLVGERRDAQVKVTFDEEFMTAYMTVLPPYGGRDLDDHLLFKYFRDEGIYEDCCDKKVIATVLKDKAAEDLAFAHGTDPIDGIDAQFEALVDEVEYSTPKESKSGKIDLREVMKFTLIEANTPLMKRIPAKQGVNGRNVKGQVITAAEAIDTPFEENLNGAAVSPENSNLLVSTCKGHPVILANGVKVDNSIVVNNVDMSTGNISYDGSLLVKGEVKAGMKIKVTGDIIVKGVVTKATLIAKNNITIECGVIGSDPKKDGNDSPPAIIRAGGDICAQYVSLAEVTAGRNIIVREYLSHCTTEAKEQVLAGQKGGKGRIFGGSCYGRGGVYANELGGTGDVKTLINAGTPKEQQVQFEGLLKAHKNREIQSAQLTDMKQKYEKAIQENPTDVDKAKKLVAIKKVLQDLTAEIDKMSSTIDKINRHFKESKKAEVSVKSATFPNVTISINNADFPIRQESKGGIFTKQGSDIRWQNYKPK